MRKVIFFLLILFAVFSGNSYALDKETFITVANPVRGPEEWQLKIQDPLTIPKLEYFNATVSAAPVTWMLRYDVIKDASMSAYFNNLFLYDNTQSLGAFLEITPNLAKDSLVNYPSGSSIFNANRAFLSGYYPNDRIKLIDTYMLAFKERFGTLPKAVGAWHIDSFSLEYLRKKYSVLVALICDEQYSTDGYRLWGGYLGSPYIPSKANVLMPAQSTKDRVDIVVVRWAQRDLFNFYGQSAESLFSVQVNDYLAKGKNTDYFGELIKQYSQKDFNEFTHINLGLENDYSKILYGEELSNTYKKIVSLKKDSAIRFISLEDLGNFVLNRYPDTAPTFFYQVTDPLKSSDAKVFWYQNPYYRIGFKSQKGTTKIIDFRAYNDKLFEDYFSTPNTDSRLFLETPSIIDSIKYPNSEKILEINLSEAKITYEYTRVKFEEGGKSITLNPQSVVFNNFSPSLESKDIDIQGSTKANSQTTWNIKPHLPLSNEFNYYYLALAIFIPLIIISFIFSKPLSVGFTMASLVCLTVVRSGNIYPFGLGIWGPNGHDAIFHISLIQKFSENPFDLSHPQLSGEKLANYHFVFDYFSGLFSKATKLSPNTVYFFVFPIVISILIVCLLNLLLKKWNFSSKEISLSFVFVFLAGSLGFIPALFTGSNPLFSESAFWANQSSSMLLNPPFAVSLVVMLIFFLLLEKFSKPNISQLLLLGIVGGSLAQTKIYAFILLCLGLLLSKRIKVLISVGLVGSAITLPFSTVSGSPFDLSPLWFTRSLFASPDRVWWPKLAQAWQTYESGSVWFKLYIVNVFAFTVFIVGNMSTRLLSVPYILKNKLTRTQLLAIYISLCGVILPSILIQKVNPWNTIQFIYYSIFLLGLFAAKAIIAYSKTIKVKFLKTLYFLLIILITTFTGIGTIYSYVGYYSSSRISNTELFALETLKDQPKGVVLSPVFSVQKSGRVPTPKPLYSYVSTAYISAYSHQPEYLSDTINLDITGYNYTERNKNAQRFYSTADKNWAKEFLNKENITYVYETPLSKIQLPSEDLCLEKIFDSGEINIYKFNCHGQK